MIAMLLLSLSGQFGRQRRNEAGFFLTSGQLCNLLADLEQLTLEL